MAMQIRLHPQSLAVSRLSENDAIPSWARGEFTSITRTNNELSIVCDEARVPDGVTTQRGWRLFELLGPFAFEVTGIAASLTKALASNGIPLLLIATFDTDYILVQREYVDRAIDAFRGAGYDVS
ncbi:MAG: ACT domain-containing protein [Thermoanaerobaculia bacterium]